MPFQLTQQPPNAAGTRTQPLVLDDRHKAVLREILRRSTWTAEELRTITSRLGLMPWACVAKLNEWAMDQFDDLPLEGDETQNVNEMLKERIGA